MAPGDLGGFARGLRGWRNLPMLAGQVDLILEFLGLSGHRPG